MSQSIDARSIKSHRTHRVRPGIRASFVIGIAVMAALMLVVTIAALLTSASMTRGVTGIVNTQLPATLSSMRLARAGDALAASGRGLMAVRSQDESARAMADVDLAQQTLADVLAELESTIGRDGIAEFTALSAELNHNLERLQTLVDERLELIDLQRNQRGELQALLQAFQQQATYRVRTVESDSAVMSMLAERADPPLAQIGGIAVRTAPLIPLARFYAQVEAIGSRTLGASQDPSLTALELSVEVINTLTGNASATLSRLPADLAAEFGDLFTSLTILAQSDTGMINLRRRELNLLLQGDVWNAENQQILNRLDTTTGALVNTELAAIHQASESVARTNQTNFWLLSSIAFVGITSLILFFYLYILRDLLARLSFLSHAMQKIAAGQYEVELPPSGSDELGRLGAAVQQFRAVALSANQREEKLQALNRQLAELSISDALTGLANRRHFDEVLAEEWSRSTRHDHSVSILMIDADFFKAYNDCYGHQAGDQCLQDIAAVIKSRVHRPGDLAARYGGEEFCVVLSECMIEGAMQVAHDIHTAIEALNIPHQKSPYGRVTVSIGVASTIPALCHSAADLLKQSDQALYKAKAAGRNQVITTQNPATCP